MTSSSSSSPAHPPSAASAPLLSPELQRNVWLELSPTRLILMPAVLLLLFLLVVSLNDSKVLEALGIAAMVMFVLITMLWGSSLAGSSVSDEVQQRTWDWQRMSSITPIEITLGKLVGGPIYAWYGGLICLVVLMVSGHIGGWSQAGYWTLMLVGVTLLAHSWAMLGALSAIARYGHTKPGKLRGAVMVFSSFFLLSFMGSVGGQLESSKPWVLTWYGMVMQADMFVLASVYLFAAWGCIGVYRLFRAELRFRNQPWLWAGFVLFLMIWLGGLAQSSDTDPIVRLVSHGHAAFALGMAAMAGAALTGLGLLYEKHDVVTYRSMLAVRRDTPFPFHLLPRWLISLLLTTACVIGLLLMGRAPNFLALVLGSWLFLLRDVTVILSLNLRASGKPADGLTLVYLVVVYGLLPGITSGSSLFVPNPEANPLATVLCPLLELAAALGWLVYRWRKLFRDPV